MKKTTSGVLAAAVTGLLLGSTTGCANPQESSATSQPMPGGEKHICKGHNECQGKGGCASGNNGCAGKNTCKGNGGCATARSSCKGQNDCKGLGGCKTAKNECAGHNECKNHGGCAVSVKH